MHLHQQKCTTALLFSSCKQYLTLLPVPSSQILQCSPVQNGLHYWKIREKIVILEFNLECIYALLVAAPISEAEKTKTNELSLSGRRGWMRVVAIKKDFNWMPDTHSIFPSHSLPPEHRTFTLPHRAEPFVTLAWYACKLKDRLIKSDYISTSHIHTPQIPYVYICYAAP